MATNSQVAHIWAQGNGRTAAGSNFRCEHNNLYSYRTLVAQIIDGVPFISQDNMTPSTAKQLSYAKRAVSYRYFQTPAFGYGHSGAMTPEELIIPRADYLKDTAFPALCRRRSGMESGIKAYEHDRDEVYTVAAKFDVTIPFEIPEATGDLKEKARRFAAQEREREKVREEQERQRRERQRIEDQERFEEWLKGVPVTFPASYRRPYTDTDYIKVSIDGETVVTSQGAEAPLGHVRRALEFYKKRRLVNDPANYHEGGPLFHPWKTNGHKIHMGHYTLDEIDEHGNVKAGCHRFTAAEIARFIEQWKEVL